MELSHDAWATLLLTGYFPGGGQHGASPLSPIEWSRLVRWMVQQEKRPQDLIIGDVAPWLGDFHDKDITLARVLALLERRLQVSINLEKWQKAGLWVITRADDRYPRVLKQTLKDASPPFFHGAGDPKVLDTKAIAVVGSRNASESDLTFARQLGKCAADQSWSIISGGARGIDEAAMRGALEHRGTVIGVVADSLLKTASSKKYRDAVMRGDIVLLSTVHPEAGFNAGNAMARNKYVYTLSRAAVIVCSDRDKGGTWAGATEGLRGGWVPVWVRNDEPIPSGNKALLGIGALALSTTHLGTIPMEQLASGQASGLSSSQVTRLDFDRAPEGHSAVGEPSDVMDPATAVEKPRPEPLKGAAQPRVPIAVAGFGGDELLAYLEVARTKKELKARFKDHDEQLDKLLKAGKKNGSIVTEGARAGMKYRRKNSGDEIPFTEKASPS